MVSEMDENEKTVDSAPVMDVKALQMGAGGGGSGDGDDSPPKLDRERVRALMMSQDYASLVDVENLRLTVEVRRPMGTEYVQVHPDLAWVSRAATIEADGDHFVLDPSLYPRFFREAKVKAFYVTINTSGKVFLWPVKCADVNGKLDIWNETAHKAAKIGRNNWVRIVTNPKTRCYDVEISYDIEAPEWPNDIVSSEDLFAIAFEDKIIYTADHRLLKNLKGRSVK
jgi:hypothetical protein